MSKVTIAGEGMRGIVKIESPSMSLYNVLKEFCVKNKLNPDNYALKHRNNNLDLSTPWRLAGLPNNCEIEIVRAVGNAKKQKSGTANIAVQLLDGSRVMNTLPLSSSLWEVLRACEQKSSVNVTKVKNEKTGVYRQPVVAMMNNAVRGVTDLSKTTLTACGLRNGDSSLFRLSLEDSTTPFDEAVKYIQQVEEELAKKAEAPTPAPQLPKPKSPFETTTTATSPSETAAIPAASSSAPSPAPAPVETPAASTQQQEAPAEATTSASASASTSSPSEDAMEVDEVPPVYVPVQDEHAVHVKVFKPSTARFDPNELTQIDEKEFELTMEDAKLAMQDMARKREDREAFRSVQTRETEKKKKQRIYDRALIRIRFPSGYFVQATFKPENTITHVINFVRKMLSQPETTFYLYVSPPVRRLDVEREKTLRDLQLLPASLINIALDKKNAKAGEAEPAIREDYLQLAQEVRQEKLPQGKLQEEIEEEKKAAASSSSSFRGEGRTLGNSGSSSASGGISRLVQQPAKKSGSQKPKWLKL